MRSEATTVDEYLNALPGPRREALSWFREAINEIAPDASELMKYGHPHWQLDGALFALASQKHHMSLYVAEKATMAKFAPQLDSLTGVNTGKGCVRFRTLDRLPADLARALLQQAVEARRAKLRRQA